MVGMRMGKHDQVDASNPTRAQDGLHHARPGVEGIVVAATAVDQHDKAAWPFQER